MSNKKVRLQLHRFGACFVKEESRKATGLKTRDLRKNVNTSTLFTSAPVSLQYQTCVFDHLSVIYIRFETREIMAIGSTVSNILTGLLIIVHSGLVAVDFLGLYPVADFMIRPDGTQMDPKNFTPQEELFVAMIAFPFLTCILGFLFTNRKDAALISAVTHGIFAVHQVWKKDRWDAIMHPNTEISTEFFLYAHVVWAIVSVVIYFLSPSGSTSTSSGGGPKIKRV